MRRRPGTNTSDNCCTVSENVAVNLISGEADERNLNPANTEQNVQP
jgi:hypothetical protein